MDLLIPKFLYKPRPVVRKTIENTTLLGKIFQEAPLHNRVVSRYPQLNKRRIFEVLSTDTIFSSILAYGWSTCAQVFVGNRSGYINIHGMQTESEGFNALHDFVRYNGAPIGIRRDQSKMQQSNR